MSSSTSSTDGGVQARFHPDRWRRCLSLGVAASLWRVSRPEWSHAAVAALVISLTLASCGDPGDSSGAGEATTPLTDDTGYLTVGDLPEQALRDHLAGRHPGRRHSFATGQIRSEKRPRRR